MSGGEPIRPVRRSKGYVDQRFEIQVDVARAADVPATHAQRALWHAVEYMWDDDTYFNLGWCVPVPAEQGPEPIATVLRRLVEHFDTFRTTFRFDDDELTQSVASTGRLSVEVHESASEPVDATAEVVLASLVGTPFRPTTEWPIRLAVVTRGGLNQLLVMVFNHLALDLYGWRVVERALKRLLVDPEADLADIGRLQPIDQAAYEASTEGQAANRAALLRWERILRRAPPTLFDFDTAPEEDQRYWLFRMDSPALAAALAVAAARVRVSNSAVLLAAVAVVMGLYTGHAESVVLINVSNRLREGSQDIAGYLCWDSLCYVNLDGLSFDAVAQRSFAAAVDSYQHGVYDRSSASALTDAIGHDLGAHIDLGCHLNDRREPTGLASTQGRSASDLPGLVDATRLTVVSQHSRVDTRFHVHAMDSANGSIALEVMADTRYFPIPRVEELLRGLESLVVGAAAGDLVPPQIGELVRLTTATRRDGWVCGRHGWTNVPRTGEVWRFLAGPESAVFTEPTNDGTTWVVAYAAAEPGRRSVGDLHRAFVAQLGDRSDIRTPDLYVCCAVAPSDVDDRSGWQACPVVEQGTGRRVSLG